MNIKSIFFLNILFLAGCVADAVPVPDVPPAIVTGAEKPVPVGELVTLTVSPNAFPSNIINVHYEWKIIDSTGTKKVWLGDNNQSVSFGTGATPGKITAILDPTYVYGDAKTKVATNVKSAGISLIEVQVGDPAPTPNPTPDPTPVPVIVPDGQFKLARVTYDSLTTTKSTNKDFLSGLSNNYKAIAQQTRTATIKNINDAYATLKKSNQDAFTKFSEKPENWTPVENAITTAVYQLYTDKKLPTLMEYATAWAEISNGFDIYVGTLK